jgi:hypothetical protein
MLTEHHLIPSVCVDYGTWRRWLECWSLPQLALEQTRGVVFVRLRKESMNRDKVASAGPGRPRAAQLGC